MSHFYLSPCWQVLGIDPTDDASAVKRAYAKRLKAVRPDEDPQGFQQLREAYETALAATQESVAPTTNFASTTPLDFSAPPSYALQQPVTFRLEPDSETVQPVPVYRFASQEPPIDARALAIAAWERFLERCAPLLRHVDQGGGYAPLTDSARAARYLAETLRSADMELIEAKVIFQQIAVQYCGSDEASPIIRVACLHGLRWEEEQRASGAFTNGYEAYAFERALGDHEYHLLQKTAHRSKAMAALLRPGPPVIPWPSMYRKEFRADLRNCLTEIRGRLHRAERFWLGADKVQAWVDALERPWPSFAVVMGALAIGILLGISPGHDSLLARGPAALLFGCLLVLLPPAAVLAYPLVKAFQKHLLTDRHIELANYLAHMALATLVLGLEQLPTIATFVFICLAFALCWLNIFLKSKSNVEQTTYLALMAVVVFAVPIRDALRPLAGSAGIFVAIFLGGLLLGPRTLAMRYGVDIYHPRIRLTALFVIVTIFGLQLALKEIASSQSNAILTVLLFTGWWWILLAAACSDPMLLFLHEHRISGMLWLPALFLLYYLPRGLDFGGPLEGIMRLEISVAAALLSALIWTKLKRA
jgi:hypothetical protein